MASVVPPRSPVEPPGAAQQTMHGLCCQLRREGRTAVVVLYSNCGDVDARVQVSDGNGPVVELLWPCPGLPDSDCWHAVRIEPDQRSIWCGPPKDCGRPRLIEFVEDVLADPPDRLRRRYRAL
jgi:hypothetical protein